MYCNWSGQHKGHKKLNVQIKTQSKFMLNRARHRWKHLCKAQLVIVLPLTHWVRKWYIFLIIQNQSNSSILNCFWHSAKTALSQMSYISCMQFCCQSQSVLLVGMNWAHTARFVFTLTYILSIILLILVATVSSNNYVQRAWAKVVTEWLALYISQATAINFNMKIMNSKQKIKLTASYWTLSTLCTVLLYTTNFCQHFISFLVYTYCYQTAVTSFQTNNWHFPAKEEWMSWSGTWLQEKQPGT